MSDEKDVVIKISYVDDNELLEEFLELTESIGLIPDEIKSKALPNKPEKKESNAVKDVKITVASDPEKADEIISEFLEYVEQELELLPASRNENLVEKK